MFVIQNLCIFNFLFIFRSPYLFIYFFVTQFLMVLYLANPASYNPRQFHNMKKFSKYCSHDLLLIDTIVDNCTNPFIHFCTRNSYICNQVARGNPQSFSQFHVFRPSLKSPDIRTRYVYLLIFR